jgi:hypothetical protein
MKKSIIINKLSILFALISLPLFAQPPQEGLYVSKGCDVMIGIENPYRDYYRYNLHNYGGVNNYGTLKIEDAFITFTDLNATYDTDSDNGKMHDSDVAFTVNAKIDSPSSLSIQNYGDSMNPYMVFDGCDKFLEYTRIANVSEMLNYMKLDRYKPKKNSYYFWHYDYKKYFDFDEANEEAHNNLAFYLYQKGYNEEAEALLFQIIDKFPDRTVAHLNYADVMEKIKQKKDYYENENIDKIHYLTYIAQMLYDKKESIIPKRLHQTYGDYYPILKIINAHIKQKYVILGEAKGDLNGDKKEDISFVIELADRYKIKKLNAFSSRYPNANPRIWLVWLKDTNGYTLLGENKNILEPDEYTNCDDPFDEIAIKNKNLSLYTHYWCSAGGWGQGSINYQFIYRDNALILAGKEERHDNRATAEGAIISTNYLTKRKKTQNTVDHGSPEGKVEWKKIDDKTPISFDDAR